MDPFNSPASVSHPLQQQQQHPQQQTIVPPVDVYGPSGSCYPYQHSRTGQGYGGTTLLPVQAQAPPSGPVQVRTDPDCEMEDADTNSSNGGSHIEEVDKHPAAYPDDVGASAPSQPHPERKKGSISKIMKNTLRTIGLVNDSEQHEVEKVQSKEAHTGSSKKERDETRRRDDLEKSHRELLKRKEEHRQVKDDRQSWGSSELQEAKAEITRLQNSAKEQVNQIVNLTTKRDEYKALADKLSDQLSSLEQSNSQAVAGTGAHKDSHAIPPNLLKASFAVKEAAFAFTKKFISYLKERPNSLESHIALKSIPREADDRYRKHAVEAYISKRLFAGFENDCYLDSLDLLRGARYLSSDLEVNEFFLHHQDLELRHGQYLKDYDEAQKLGLRGYLVRFETMKAGSANSFHQFCCRKLVSIMDGVDGFSKEFPPFADYSEHCLLYRLATEPTFRDQILKPFMSLAIAAYLLHRLAFQFNPAARIFRFAPETKFDKTYMENAFPIDDDVSDEGLIVGHMLSPGFQVGATIAKCKVYLVQA